jgi:hypothetical protein
MDEVTVVVHRINTDVHPGQHGWRWAVMIGGAQPADIDLCVGAGQQDDEPSASNVGEIVGAAVTQALRHFGHEARYTYMRMGYDPIPAAADHRPLSIWRGEDEERR